MRPDRQDDSSIAQQASEWFFALDKADAAEQAAFGAWLRESPRHVEEFLLVTAAYKELEDVAADHRVDVDEIRAELASSVLPLRNDSVTPRPSGKLNRQRRGAMAAVLVGLVAGGWLLSGGFLNGQSYSTAVGEIRSFELQDGSVIELNTRSRVKVHFSAERREIQLLDGEAMFKVARNPARPFLVHAGSAMIQAVGTEFNVYRRPQGTTVSVIEGVVRVSEADGLENASANAAGIQTLAAGQEVRIAPDGHIKKLAVADTTKVTAWRQRRLVFRGDQLADVAAEFNRYNRAMQIRVEGGPARSKQLAGIFDADDPDSLLLFLEGVGDLTVERHGNEIVIRPRGSD